MKARRRGTAAISLLLVILGLAVIGRTIQAGVGGGLGLVMGVMLVAAGALRLYLTMAGPAADRAKPGRRRKGEQSR
jgi:hypothetical protein